jgi:hypothetical protein
MYAYTVTATMRIANDDYDPFAEPGDSHAGITLYLLLGCGAALLAFLTWLLTL